MKRKESNGKEKEKSPTGDQGTSQDRGDQKVKAGIEIRGTQGEGLLKGKRGTREVRGKEWVRRGKARQRQYSAGGSTIREIQHTGPTGSNGRKKCKQ